MICTTNSISKARPKTRNHTRSSKLALKLNLCLPSIVQEYTRSAPRRSPRFNPTAACAPQPAPDSAMQALLIAEWDAHDWCHSSDALTDWLNARWAKSGYVLCRQECCFLLRLSGRDARMGLGDERGGAFVREVVKGSSFCV